MATHRRQVTVLSAALAGRGHDVTIYLSGTDAGLDDDSRTCAAAAGVRIETGPPEPELAGFAAFLSERWSGGLPALVHATGTASGVCAVEAAGSRILPLVQDARGAAAPRGERAAMAVFERAHRVLAMSSDHAALLARTGISHHKLAVLAYGTRSDAMTSSGELRPVRQVRMLVCPDGPALAGGVHDVVTALSGLAGAELVVVGGPDVADLDADPDVRHLRELAARLEIADRVQVRGRLGDAELCRLYGQADLVVTVPRRPGPGLTALEAMACGACVVASATGGARDAVLHGITGLLVPPGDPRALCRGLRGLLAQPTLRSSWGFAAVDRARSRYGWDQLAQEGERIFLEAARAGGYWPGAFTGLDGKAQPAAAGPGHATEANVSLR